MVGGCAGSEACVDFVDEVLVVASRTDDGADTRIEVELRRAAAGEDSIPVKLCADNTLKFDGAALAGVKRPNGAVVYEATVDSKTDTELVVHTLRLSNDDGVSEFSAEVDAPGFAITAPASNAKVSRAGALAVAWEPARADGTIVLRLSDEIDGETCLAAPLELDMPDSGEATIAAGEIALAPDTSPKATCASFVTLSRRAEVALATTRGGVTLHPDSRIEATNSRVRAFRSVP
jgi:hypothetical protein